MSMMNPSTSLEQKLFAAELGLALFTNSPDGMLLVDSEGVIRMVNNQAELMFGYPRAELVDMQVEILVPDDVRDQHAEHRHDFGDDPHPRSMGANLKLQAKRKNGTTFPVEISLGPVVSERGMFTAVTIRRARAR